MNEAGPSDSPTPTGPTPEINVQISSAASASPSIDPSTDPKRKAKSKDPGWKYGYWPDLQDKNKIRCILCKKDMNQGIKRLKQHLAGGYGDVVKCTKVSSTISKEMQDFIVKNRKRKPTNLDDPEDDLTIPILTENETEVHVAPSSDVSTRAPSSGTVAKRNKIVFQPQVRGPMDTHVRRTPEDVVAERRAKGQMQTTIERHFRTPEEKKKTDSYVAKWWFEAGIPFNAANRKSFEVMMEAVAQYGPGYKPPTFHELRMPLLKSEKDSIEEIKKKHQTYWKTFGCTLMSDGWSDKRGRHLINFLVNSPEGSFFLGSVDASNQVQDANMLFKLLDNKIEEIGEENVIQVVTDNASNYVAAGRLMEKRTKLYWTPCAAHCIDLMLEDIGKLRQYKIVIAKARRLTSFIYRHTRLLDAMRVRTGGRDLVRTAVTRFATAFLTLQSLFKFKDELRLLFLSEDWKESKVASTEMGKKVSETVFATTFWNGLEDCLRASQPLLIVLRIVDGDERPAMAEVCMAMEEAKKKIKLNFANKERLYKKVIDIVDERWTCQMSRPLYGAAFFLNPSKYFEYRDSESASQAFLDKVQDQFNDVLQRMVSDPKLQDQIVNEADMYACAKLSFGRPMAIRQRSILRPIAWWNSHGSSGPELKLLAKRILGLCCSASGCERNWSTFEFIHTKKRNRLEHQRLNDLVYIQYNRRLEARFQEMREQGNAFDPLQLDDFDWSSEWMLGQPQDELVHHGDDLTWEDVDTALEASTSFQGRNRPRRDQASISRGRGANVCYRRRVRERDVVEEYSDEGEEEEEVDLHDDEDVDEEDGDGWRATDTGGQQQPTINLLEGFI